MRAHLEHIETGEDKSCRGFPNYRSPSEPVMIRLTLRTSYAQAAEFARMAHHIGTNSHEISISCTCRECADLQVCSDVMDR